MIRQLCIAIATTLVIAVPPSAAQPLAKSAGAEFPSKGKGIRVVIPFPPGGGNDVLARFLVHGLNEGFAPGSVADNRGGAGTVIGTEIAAKGNPDGHTLLIVSVPFVVMNVLYPQVKIDPLKDFTPVINAGISPSLMLVGAATPYKSVKDVIDAARAKPGALAYATSGNGSSTHLIMELFKRLSQTNLVHVPYKGSGPAMTAIMSGQVPVMFNNLAAATAFVKAGRLRALGVTAPARLKVCPEVPTMAEAGVPAARAACSGVWPRLPVRLKPSWQSSTSSSIAFSLPMMCTNTSPVRMSMWWAVHRRNSAPFCARKLRCGARWCARPA